MNIAYDVCFLLFFSFIFVTLRFFVSAQQVLRGGSSDVHAKASQTVGHKEIEMSFDEIGKNLRKKSL